MKTFLDSDFLLESESAKRLYHNYAANMPIFDYHCHLPPEQVAMNHAFENLTRIWLKGDHYKWRAMRANGIDEEYITGSRSDREKFQAWASTVPSTIGNPLYHWTHLELKSPFGITGTLLSADSADSIYDECGELLSTEDFRVRSIMEKFQVKAVCTTDDPIDDLDNHKAVAADALFKIKMLPTFRPDRALAVNEGDVYLKYISKLEESSRIEINSYQTLLDALDIRHLYFHDNGCRLSDHAIMIPEFISGTDGECNEIFLKVRKGQSITVGEEGLFRTRLLIELGRMNSKRGWVMQLHLGALRNINTRMYRYLGPDTGFDTIADGTMAKPLARLLDELDSTSELPKTIIYTLNPRDNDLIATMIGGFQDGTIPGKIQFGTGWWFNDQKDGMINQMTSLANGGLLSRFVGMLTDSRSFLSYPRHEYFRRILSNLLGSWIEKGEAPADFNLIGNMVKDICYNNAAEYFGIKLED